MRSSSAATFARSCRRTASTVTARTISSGRPSCASIPKPACSRSSAAKRLSSRSSRKRAKPCDGWRPTTRTSGCRPRKRASASPRRSSTSFAAGSPAGRSGRSTGRICRPCAQPSRAPEVRITSPTRSTRSSRQSWNKSSCRSLPRPTRSRSCAGCRSTRSACRRRRKKSTPFSQIRVPTRTRGKWPDCWLRPISASAGDGSGSMRPAMPTPMATRKTNRGRSGSTAIG
jgi:hypothetical protein